MFVDSLEFITRRNREDRRVKIFRLVFYASTADLECHVFPISPFISGWGECGGY